MYKHSRAARQNGDKMKRKICAFIATVLLLSLTLNIVASGVEPFSDPITSLNGFRCENGTLEAYGDGIRLNIEAEGASVSFNLPKPVSETSANVLSIVMSNISSCTDASVTVTTDDGEANEYNLDINSFTRRVTYNLPLDRYEEGAEVRILFENVSSGAVCLYSACGISTFDDSFDNIGDISACEYTSRGITLKGTLKHDTVIKHDKATISVYSLDPGQTLEDILSGEVLPHIENSPMSMRFEFSIKTEEVSDRLKRYAVAIVDSESGNIEFIDTPRYPEASSVDLNGGIFKGIESSVTSCIIDSGAGLCILDVDTSALLSSDSGYMLSVDGERYFFDRAYVSELDAKVKILSGSGTEVILRLGGLSASYSINEQEKAYAVAKFLSSRYNGGLLGTVVGFAVGHRVNDRLDPEHTVAEYVLAYCNTVYSVLAAANDSNTPMGIVVSVSDRWGTEPTPYSVSTDLFLGELFKICGYYRFPTFSVMPEVTSSPKADLNYTEGSGNVTNPDERATAEQRAVLSDSDRITLDNISSICRNISDVSKKYVGDSADIIYLWRPDASLSGTEMAAAYVLEFYTLYFETNIRSFVFSVAGDSTEQIKKINDLKYKMRYIDTERSLEVGDFAREVFGISEEWSEKFVKFSEDDIAYWDLRDTLVPHNGVLPEIMGTYAYWDFGGSSNRGGWYTGLNCSSVSVGNVSDTGRVLVAKMTPGQVGEYSILAYDYDNEESFRYNDYLIVEFALESESQADNFEINFMIGGKSFRYEYKGDGYFPGKTYKVCLDVSSMTEQNPAEYLRFCVRNLSDSESQYSFLLHSVSAASTDATNDELKNLIREERDRITGDGVNSPKNGINILWIAVIAAVVIVTVAVMIMIGKKNHTRSEDRV